MERLLQTQLLWDGACERLSRLALNTARTSQLVRHQHSSPQLWLQAHRPLHQQLQVQPTEGALMMNRFATTMCAVAVQRLTQLSQHDIKTRECVFEVVENVLIYSANNKLKLQNSSLNFPLMPT